MNEESRVSGNNIIHYRVMVRLLGNECALHVPPVDAKDALVKDVDVELEADTQVIPPNRIGTLQPPAPVTFTLRVTCDGIPVKNAEAHIEVEVRNGGHQHGTGNSRPRGYLNGKRLTEEEPKIQVETNHQGVATITFLPGRDTLTGSRGIAGTYLVTARLDDERFSNREETRVVLVKRTDFVPLFVGDDTYVVVRGDTQEHPAGTWGQPITMDAIARLAEEFQAAQEQHNEELITLGEQPWPVVPLSVNDISLQDGGLFDVTAFDVAAQTVSGQDWQPPHYAHLEGTSVDLNTFKSNPHRAWLVATVRRLGERFGAWVTRQPTLTLEVYDGSQSASLASTSPDPGVTAFLNRPSDIPASAPGQVISYTIALDNLNGGQEASAVTLATTLPPGLEFVSASPQPTGFGTSQQPLWEVGALPANALPELFQIVAQVKPEITPGSLLTVTAEINAGSVDANPTNNQDSFAFVVQSPGADLVVASDLDAVAMTVDQPVNVRLDVANLGNASAPDTLLRLAIPDSVTLLDAYPLPTTKEADEVTWSLGELAIDAEQAITVALQLEPSLLASVSTELDEEAPERLTYTLSASAAVADIAPANNQQQVAAPITVGGSNVALWLAAPNVETPGVFSPGQVVTYTLSYGNFGNQLASATGITLSLGSGLTFVQAAPAPNQTMTSAIFPGSVSAWEIGDLPVGATGVIELQVRVDSAPVKSASLYAIAHTATWELDALDNLAQGHFTTVVPVINPVSANIFIPLVVR